MRSFDLSRLGLAAAAAALLALAVAAPAGAVTHAPLGAVVSGMGNICGVAVDSERHLYVSDYNNDEVDILSSNGGVLTELPSAGPEHSPCELAVDSGGNVYVNTLHRSVFKHVPSVYPFPPFGFPNYGPPTEIAAERATGVAVDPTTDVVYVAHRDHIAAYEADGTPVLDGAEPLRVGDGTLGDGYGLAVSGFAGVAGHVYVGDAADQTVKVYDPAGDPSTPVLVLDGSATPPGGFRDLVDTDLTIDESNGHLFVLDNLQRGRSEPLGAVYEFDPLGAYQGQLTTPIVHGGPSGLAVDNSIDIDSGKPVGTLYVSSHDEDGGIVNAFCPAEPIGAELEQKCLTPPNQELITAKTGNGEGTVRSAPGPIECGTVCAWEFPAGTSVTLTATPRRHSVFKGWTVAGLPGVCSGTGNCQLAAGAASEVEANFEAIPQRTLTVGKTGPGEGTVQSRPGGIRCGEDCAAAFDQGSLVTLSAGPRPGFRFSGWSGGGCSGTGDCVVKMDANTAVSAAFEPLVTPPPPPSPLTGRILSISVLGGGAGTIASNPAGIDCGTPCAAVYPPGTTVELVASPDPESRFAGWGGCTTAAASRCTVTLAESRAVVAVFEEAAPQKECRKPKRGGSRSADRSGAASAAKRKPRPACKGKAKPGKKKSKPGSKR